MFNKYLLFFISIIILAIATHFSCRVIEGMTGAKEKETITTYIGPNGGAMSVKYAMVSVATDVSGNKSGKDKKKEVYTITITSPTGSKSVYISSNFKEMSVNNVKTIKIMFEGGEVAQITYIPGTKSPIVLFTNVHKETSIYYKNIKDVVTPSMDSDLYILKSEIVPPVCPICPVRVVTKKCPPCPSCSRCPENNINDYEKAETNELLDLGEEILDSSFHPPKSSSYDSASYDEPSYSSSSDTNNPYMLNSLSSYISKLYSIYNPNIISSSSSNSSNISSSNSSNISSTIDDNELSYSQSTKSAKYKTNYNPPLITPPVRMNNPSTFN